MVHARISALEVDWGEMASTHSNMHHLWDFHEACVLAAQFWDSNRALIVTISISSWNSSRSATVKEPVNMRRADRTGPYHPYSDCSCPHGQAFEDPGSHQ